MFSLKKGTAAMLAAGLAMGLCTAVLADTPNPVFWTTKPPAGDAATHNNIIQMGWVDIWDEEEEKVLTPYEVALEAINIVEDYPAGHTCICIARLG